MFDPAISQVIAPVIGTFAGAIITWLFTRKKDKKELDLLEIEAVRETLNIWKELADELKEEYKTLHASFIEMKAENKALKSNLVTIKSQLDSFKKENENLLRHIKEIKATQA